MASGLQWATALGLEWAMESGLEWVIALGLEWARESGLEWALASASASEQALGRALGVE